MAKNDQFYFQNFLEAADYGCKAAEYLVKCMKDFDPDEVERMLMKMHEFEHAADRKKHEMSAALAKAFVTPIDREDLALLSQNIDEVTDCIEEVLQRFFIDQITTVPSEAVAFAEKLVICCERMKEMLSEFSNFKKSSELHRLIVNINQYEEECDQLYLTASRKLRDQFDDVLTVISWREIYDRMENCADACEHVGDCVETVVMKNT